MIIEKHSNLAFTNLYFDPLEVTVVLKVFRYLHKAEITKNELSEYLTGFDF